MQCNDFPLILSIAELPFRAQRKEMKQEKKTRYAFAYTFALRTFNALTWLQIYLSCLQHNKREWRKPSRYEFSQIIETECNEDKDGELFLRSVTFSCMISRVPKQSIFLLQQSAYKPIRLMNAVCMNP